MSVVPAGALHAFADVENVDHAVFFVEVQVDRAVLKEDENVDHAVLTAAFTAEGVVKAYACCKAVARAV